MLEVVKLRAKPLVRGCRVDIETGKKFDEAVAKQGTTKQVVLEALIKAYLELLRCINDNKG